MTSRPRNLSLAVALLVALLVATAVAATTYTAYRNQFTTRSAVNQMKHVSLPGGGKNCSRRLSSKRMRVTVGNVTTECSYAPPIQSSGGGTANFAVNVTSEISTATPKSLRSKLFTSVALRLTDRNAKYRLDIYSSDKKFALRRYRGSDPPNNPDVASNAHVLASGTKGFIKTPGNTNRLRIKIFDIGTNGDKARLIAKVNGKLLANLELTNPPNAILRGERVAVTVGRNSGSAKGAIAAFDNLSVEKTF